MTVKRIALLILLMCVVVVGGVIGLRAQAKPPAEPCGVLWMAPDDHSSRLQSTLAEGPGARDDCGAKYPSKRSVQVFLSATKRND
jgi:hypothetical protein